jgi:hypothetical protein
MNNPVANRDRAPIDPVHGVRWITVHAARQWQKRSPSKQRLTGLMVKLDEMLRRSQPGHMSVKNRLAYILRHDCQPATLRICDQWVFVIEGDTVVTVHENERGHVQLGDG